MIKSRHLFFLFLICCLCVKVSAQNEKLEELKLRLQNAKHDTTRVITLYKLAAHSNYIGNLREALEYCNQSVQLAKQIHFTRGLAGAYNNLGVVNFNKGNYPEALKNYLLALKFSKEANMTDVLSQATMNVGIVYAVQKEYDKAFLYLNESAAILKKQNDTLTLADLYNNMGCLYTEQGKYDAALKSHNLALHLYLLMDSRRSILGVYDNIGEVYLKTGSYPEALSYFFNSLKIGVQTKDKYGLAYAENRIGEIYLKQKKYSEATDMLNTGLTHAKETGSLDIIKEAYKNLYEVYNAINNDSKALSNYRNYVLYRDSIFNQENTRKIVQSQMQYDFDVKMAADSVKAFAENQKQDALDRQKNKYYKAAGVAFLFVLIVIISLIVISTSNKQKLQKKLAIQQTRDSIARDLHDEIGSTLTSITYMSEFGKISNHNKDEKNTTLMLEKIGNTSSSLASLMNDIIWAVNPEKDDSKEMVVRMKWYVNELMQTRNIHTSFNVNPDFESWNFTIEQKKNIYLIFKEALNNCFKYAQCNNLTIDLRINNKVLSMKISDDGIGFVKSLGHQGNGLKNITKRAENIGATVSIGSEPNAGTEVNLVLNL